MKSLAEILDEIPNCQRLKEVDEHKQKTADYLYASKLVVEVKEVKIRASKILHDLHEAMRKEAGIVSTVKKIPLAEMAKRTGRAPFWYKRFTNKLFRSVEQPLRDARKQVYQTCNRMDCQYGVILLGIHGDSDTVPEDFGPLCARFIHRQTENGDQKFNVVSEIGLFHFGQPWRASNVAHETAIQLIQTEFGMNDTGYKQYMDALLQDMSEYPEIGEMAFVDMTVSWQSFAGALPWN